MCNFLQIRKTKEMILIKYISDKIYATNYEKTNLNNIYSRYNQLYNHIFTVIFISTKSKLTSIFIIV